MSYADDLKHPKWQRKRLEIMERDGWKCASCNADEKQLHVHHQIYLRGRRAWEYANEDLTTLCEDCHSKYQKVMNRYSAEDRSGRMEILLSLFGPDARFERRPTFAFFGNPRMPDGSIIFHVPSGLWRAFHLSVEDAVRLFDERPGARQELLGLIVASARKDPVEDA